ncbi:AvrD family protein [Amycolatopsis sp. NPDC049691]|uniref:AvrD family protein n=1 Tax=Amycolatopsis sp. NPDC049691 TaxID=3155155 RepID=UPI00343819D4
MTGTSLRKAVDDHLGPGAKRFFSAGYRRVGYRFGPVVADVRSEHDTTVTTHVGLSYPGDWSKKADGDLRPHLSTIDAIVLGVQLAEACVVRAFRLDGEAHRTLWVRRVRIRAGRAPEEDLTELPLEGRLTGTGTGTVLPAVSVVDCRVGAMRVRCEVEHGGGAAVAGHDLLPGLDTVLGPAENRYYGSGFTRGGHRIDDLEVDLDTLSATARVELTDAEASQGAEAAYAPAPTMVDAFATGLQLAQILLYELDGMHRRDSNTLWMRTTTLTTLSPHRTFDRGLPLHTRLAEPRLVEMQDGVWRTADIHTEFAGVAFTCGVTHALPHGS